MTDIYFPDTATVISWLPADLLIHLTIFLMVCYSCLKTRREATSALLWIFVAWSFPIIGPLLYLLFGINRVPYKAWRKHKADQRLQAERQAREQVSLPMFYWRTVRESLAGDPEDEAIRFLNRTLNRIIPGNPLLAGNAIAPLVDGDQAYPRMLETIGNARHHIHIQTFIIGHDEIGKQFMDLLAEKARAGITVRFLYDRFGSTAAVVGGLFARYRNTPNMNIAGWAQASRLKRQIQINLRNHRKIIVVDGKTAFAGGINLRNDNTSRPSSPAIRDYHFKMEGPIVQELQYSFLRDWYFVTEDDPDTLLHAGHFPPQAAAGQTFARVANSGPTPDEMELVGKVFFECVNWARRELFIVTPYFVPSTDILQSLKSAAYRGVAVKLVVPRQNNHIFAGLASKAYYDEMMEAGILIFERRPPFMHAKAVIADDKVAIIGSANWDTRSLRLNYESNILVYDNVFIRKLRKIVLNDLALSDGIDLAQWRRRPTKRKLLENFCHLMTPVL